MKPEKAIQILWKKLDVAALEMKMKSELFKVALEKRDPEIAGDYASEILRIMIEIYTRLGCIAALEEIR